MATPTDVTGPVNIGNPTKSNIIELAQMTLDLVGSRSRLVRRPLPEDDPQQRQPDISLADELLGWKPRVALKDGLMSTVAYISSDCSPIPTGGLSSPRKRRPERANPDRCRFRCPKWPTVSPHL